MGPLDSSDARWGPLSLDVLNTIESIEAEDQPMNLQEEQQRRFHLWVKSQTQTSEEVAGAATSSGMFCCRRF